MALSAKHNLPAGLRQLGPNIYEIPQDFKSGMRVPGIIFADRELIGAAAEDKAIEQVANVAHLPGIVKASLAMPDVHWGYGFPIGGVAATRVDDGVVSPGGVGFDISCGVRLLRSDMEVDDIRTRIAEILHELSRNIPKGLGGKGKLILTLSDIDSVLASGAEWCVEQGYGWREDLEVIEHCGRYKNADPTLVSLRAKERGLHQLGTLGSGNHFVEIQEVAEVFDPAVAKALGLFLGQLTVMIHTGSRGLGHQVCTDYLKNIAGASKAYGFDLPDRQLACAPHDSKQGRNYMKAMAAAANFGLANRQTIAHLAREAFGRLFHQGAGALGMRLVYDLSHNIAQFEKHQVDNEIMELCVHRKGATRAFGPGQEEVSPVYREMGQPVLVPGDMGTASYVLLGTKKAMTASWGSTCHGAGRAMSRKAASKKIGGRSLLAELKTKGVLVEAGNIKSLPEEAPYAYKDVDRVVDVCDKVGLSRRIARLRPLGVLKG